MRANIVVQSSRSLRPRSAGARPAAGTRPRVAHRPGDAFAALDALRDALQRAAQCVGCSGSPRRCRCDCTSGTLLRHQGRHGAGETRGLGFAQRIAQQRHLAGASRPTTGARRQCGCRPENQTITAISATAAGQPRRPARSLLTSSMICVGSRDLHARIGEDLAKRGTTKFSSTKIDARPTSGQQRRVDHRAR